MHLHVSNASCMVDTQYVLGEPRSIVHSIRLLPHPCHPAIDQFLILPLQLPTPLLGHIKLKRQRHRLIMHMLGKNPSANAPLLPSPPRKNEAPQASQAKTRKSGYTQQNPRKKHQPTSKSLAFPLNSSSLSLILVASPVRSWTSSPMRLRSCPVCACSLCISSARACVSVSMASRLRCASLRSTRIAAKVVVLLLLFLLVLIFLLLLALSGVLGDADDNDDDDDGFFGTAGGLSTCEEGRAGSFFFVVCALAGSSCCSRASRPDVRSARRVSWPWILVDNP